MHIMPVVEIHLGKVFEFLNIPHNFHVFFASKQYFSMKKTGKEIEKHRMCLHTSDYFLILQQLFNNRAKLGKVFLDGRKDNSLFTPPLNRCGARRFTDMPHVA
jgi:hypothetical protein